MLHASDFENGMKDSKAGLPECAAGFFHFWEIRGETKE